jgi:hypothetical protein
VIGVEQLYTAGGGGGGDGRGLQQHGQMRYYIFDRLVTYCGVVDAPSAYWGQR